jgi:hypothetical protein
VWESNPPLDPLRAESPALKTGEITGPLSPPLESITGDVDESGKRKALVSGKRWIRCDQFEQLFWPLA